LSEEEHLKVYSNKSLQSNKKMLLDLKLRAVKQEDGTSPASKKHALKKPEINQDIVEVDSSSVSQTPD
jgi:hypothetical protein